MLSRIAESLYWIGRYIERAEGTARLLDVHYHLLVEDRYVDEREVCSALLGAMGVDVDSLHGEMTAASVTAMLTQDTSFPGSVTASVASAWANARGAREALSSEIWETVNSMHQELPRRLRAATLAGSGRHDLFRWVKDRVAAVGGLVDATMSRDDGFRFLVLGRSLERADMTARLLAARCAEAAGGGGGWTTTLRSCSAHEAYLRTYRRGVDSEKAVEFLVLDRLFPRSIYCALSIAERCLAEIDPRADRSGVDDEAKRRAGRLCAALEFLRGDEVLATLPRLLTQVEDGCQEVHDALAERYFRETRVIEWSA
ncbi:MAG: alpha-E domain-containing protein [Acidimicrobiia bacterium]